MLGCPDTCDFATSLSCPKPCNTYLSRMERMMDIDSITGFIDKNYLEDITNIENTIDSDGMISIIDN